MQMARGAEAVVQAVSEDRALGTEAAVAVLETGGGGEAGHAPAAGRGRRAAGRQERRM